MFIRFCYYISFMFSMCIIGHVFLVGKNFSFFKKLFIDCNFVGHAWLLFFRRRKLVLILLYLNCDIIFSLEFKVEWEIVDRLSADKCFLKYMSCKAVEDLIGPGNIKEPDWKRSYRSNEDLTTKKKPGSTTSWSNPQYFENQRVILFAEECQCRENCKSKVHAFKIR